MYVFSNVKPGDYSYPGGGQQQHGDVDDLNLTPDNSIKVTREECETNSGNNFVFADSINGSISGTLTNHQGKPLVGIKIQLEKLDGNVFATTLTGSNGPYTRTQGYLR